MHYRQAVAPLAACDPLFGLGVGMGKSVAADRHVIVSFDNDGKPLATTQAPHGLAGSETITVSGTGAIFYDGIYDGGAGEWEPTAADQFKLNTAVFAGTATGRWD